MTLLGFVLSEVKEFRFGLKQRASRGRRLLLPRSVWQLGPILSSRPLARVGRLGFELTLRHRSSKSMRCPNTISCRVESVVKWKRTKPSYGKSSIRAYVSMARLVDCNQEYLRRATALVSLLAEVSNVCLAEVISCLAAASLLVQSCSILGCLSSGRVCKRGERSSNTAWI